MRDLLFASLAADNALPFYRSLVDYLAGALRISVRLVEDVPWQQRAAMLRRGEAHLGVVCGLQYVLWRSDLELVAAPVMLGERYGGLPVYFSDVVVRRGSAVGRFEHLAGACFAVNEPTSHSGYGVVRSTLAQRGLGSGFFGEVVESGAHESSLALLLRGEVDAASIDSTVLETELRRRPSLADDVRVVETLGPSPIPPLVASAGLPLELREACARALLAWAPAGGAASAVARFVAVADADYDEIRRMAPVGERVVFENVVRPRLAAAAE
jgi:phosphonate transport system substrate-binding protein